MSFNTNRIRLSTKRASKARRAAQKEADKAASSGGLLQDAATVMRAHAANGVLLSQHHRRALRSNPTTPIRVSKRKARRSGVQARLAKHLAGAQEPSASGAASMEMAV